MVSNNSDTPPQQPSAHQHPQKHQTRRWRKNNGREKSPSEEADDHRIASAKQHRAEVEWDAATWHANWKKPVRIIQVVGIVYNAHVCADGTQLPVLD
jgi:hypothetical protein